MGNAYIAINALLRGLKLEVIPPPPVTRLTLELGIKYSPEFACLPLKINVGNFIEALQQGADTIIMVGGWGPCRLGYYAQVERNILRDLGYTFDLVILEAPEFELSQLFNQLKGLGQNVSLIESFRAIKFAWAKLNAVEKLEKKLESCLPRCDDPDQTEKIYDQALTDLDRAEKIEEVKKITAAAVESLESLSLDRPCLEIGLVGEIYTVLEPAANSNISRYLGRLGVEVTRSIYLSDWINDHLLGGFIKKSNHQRIIDCARPYLNSWVGGHGQETVGCTVDFARRKYDGVIQIGPLTCMPEIVAQSILPSVSAAEKIPCMTLYFDEHYGSAGVYTRLEAFVDMVARKKFESNIELREVQI